MSRQPQFVGRKLRAMAAKSTPPEERAYGDPAVIAARAEVLARVRAKQGVDGPLSEEEIKAQITEWRHRLASLRGPVPSDHNEPRGSE